MSTTNGTAAAQTDDAKKAERKAAREASEKARKEIARTSFQLAETLEGDKALKLPKPVREMLKLIRELVPVAYKSLDESAARPRGLTLKQVQEQINALYDRLGKRDISPDEHAKEVARLTATRDRIMRAEKRKAEAATAGAGTGADAGKTQDATNAPAS